MLRRALSAIEAGVARVSSINELTALPSTMTFTDAPAEPATWHPTACILCECNCGVEVLLGDDGRFERIRGDRAHPASAGYTCNKALRLDAYQNGRTGRITRPLRRRPVRPF